MSGHSKWASIKHKKGALDKKRGKLFAKLIKQVEVAARQGGGDVSANATLRTMVQKARDASVPNDTIKNAPSSFNSQSTRVVVLLGDEHTKLWEEIVKPAVKAVAAVLCGLPVWRFDGTGLWPDEVPGDVVRLAA